jgi:hypothetical protein
MNVLTTTWRQLVSRRLWPVAVLLVAALVAVPMLLKKEPEPIVPSSPATSEAPAENAKADDGDAFAEPVVSKASTADRSRRRRVLGARKDPFEPAPVKKPKKTKKATQSTHANTSQPSDPAPATPSAPSAPSTPSTPVTPVAPAPKKKVYAKGSLIVRFGEANGGVLKRLVLPSLGGLPNEDEKEALLVYTGTVNHGRKAQFLLDASLEATGDATCQPHPSNCEQVELAAGETEFFDVIDPESGDTIAQYELDLVKIN